MLGWRVAYSEDESGSVARGVHEVDQSRILQSRRQTLVDTSVKKKIILTTNNTSDLSYLVDTSVKKKSEIRVVISLLPLMYTSTRVN